jgi:hypothetical protein
VPPQRTCRGGRTRYARFMLSSKPEQTCEAEPADEEEWDEVTPVVNSRPHDVLRIAWMIEEGNPLPKVVLA